MKILFFIHSLSLGGAERVTANLANYWAARGWEITIVTIAGKEKDFYSLHPGVKRIALNLAASSSNFVKALFYNTKRVLALRKVLGLIHPDVAVGMMTTANVLLVLASQNLRIPVIGSERIHPPMLDVGAWWAFMRRKTYPHLRALVALTDRSALWLKEYTGAKKVEVIPNPVPFPLPVHEPIVEPEKVWSPGKKKLLAVGRLAEQKGFDLLIKGFAQLAPRFPHWQLAIVGEGKEHKALEDLISRLGLQGKVFLVGRVGNIGDWYQAADLYVMSSRFEGFPNTLIEAMAYGLPVVSTDCETGPREIVRQGVDGLLVPPNDLPALVRALARLMDDTALRQRMSKQAVKVRERFGLPKIAKKWEWLFQEAMETAKAQL